MARWRSAGKASRLLWVMALMGPKLLGRTGGRAVPADRRGAMSFVVLVLQDVRAAWDTALLCLGDRLERAARDEGEHREWGGHPLHSTTSFCKGLYSLGCTCFPTP